MFYVLTGTFNTSYSRHLGIFHYWFDSLRLVVLLRRVAGNSLWSLILWGSCTLSRRVRYVYKGSRRRFGIMLSLHLRVPTGF